MSGSSQQSVYALGATLLAVPAGNTGTPVTMPKACNGVIVGYQSGGTLAITNQLAQAASAGVILSATERINIDGPASFFLCAGGSTSVAGIIFKYSSGYSLAL